MLITYQAKLLEKIEIAPEIYLLKFAYPENSDWTYNAGQYMIFHLPVEEKGHPARRLYSIASSPLNKEHLDFIIELIPNGLGSTYVKNIQIGDIATLQGPAGLFTFKPSERESIFLATGTGIAPIYSIISTLLNNNSGKDKKLHLFWGMKYAKDLYIMDELQKLAEGHPNFRFTVCLSREEGEIDELTCIKGRVTHGLEQLTTQDARSILQYDYYICGGPVVVESLRKFLEEKQIPRDQIHFEKFT